VPLGAGWFRQWIARYLRDGVGRKLRSLVEASLSRVEHGLGPTAVALTAANAAHVLKAQAFARWFPLQKAVAEWLGDTRLVPEGRRLVGDALLDELRGKLRPGDILLARRNWYLSNVGLPGFWPHAALYLGSPTELEAELGSDPEVRSSFGNFGAELARKHGAAWQAWLAPGPDQRQRCVIEAVGEGVILTSLHHACGADYVAALRPRMARRAVAEVVDRALGYFGRPYDFNFDFVTDDAVVCSELVMKAFETGAHCPGLRVPYVSIAGRPTVPPNEIARTFARERGREDRQLDFVAFLEGREAEGKAVVGDADGLAASCDRSKWDLAQP
jgi:hypothetical protein